MPKTGKTHTVHEWMCRSCGWTFWGKIKEGKEWTPDHCPDCKNQYWNREYVRSDMVVNK